MSYAGESHGGLYKAPTMEERENERLRGEGENQVY